MSISGKADAKRPRPPRKRAASYPARLLDEDLLGTLERSDIPLSAYDIAARLSEHGRYAVVASVYRSLDRLCSRRLIEKVEMTSGFRIRDVPQAILVNCVECGRTTPLPVPALHAALEAAIAAAGFAADKIALEAAGICHDCRVQHRS